MKAFISYSHQDSSMLEILHKHLSQLQRDGTISTWTDEAIPAGGNLEKNISSALTSSNLFISLLSPDYISSNYCFEKEFEKALDMQEREQIIIIPIILEPCDWHNTPFSKFKALPKDGKAISTWENKNTAFLDVIQNIRKLVEAADNTKITSTVLSSSPVTFSRNFRVQKDFDSIQKIEFIEKTFSEVKDYLKRYIDEIVQLDNINKRILVENDKDFECLLVNRNKIAMESRLEVSINANNQDSSPFSSGAKELNYAIVKKDRPQNRGFSLAFDDYRMFWTEDSYSYSNSREKREFESKEIAETIFNQWLESVGIV